MQIRICFQIFPLKQQQGKLWQGIIAQGRRWEIGGAGRGEGGEFEWVFWVINFKMSRRSLLSWGNLDASINFPPDLMDSNSRFPLKMRTEDESGGFGMRSGYEEDSCDQMGMFGLENTVNFCDLAGRMSTPSFAPTVISQNREEEVSNQAPSDALGKKGLKRMAGLLLRTILNRRFCSHQEVATEVQRLLGPRSQRSPQERKEEKNIKRRVYDALNVMIAAGALERQLEAVDRSVQTLHFRNSCRATRLSQLETEASIVASRLARKRELRSQTHAQLQAVRKCLLKNKNTHSSTNANFRLPFPLVILLQDGRSRMGMEVEQQQIIITHPCLQIYSQTDLLEKALGVQGGGQGEAKEEQTAIKDYDDGEDVIA